MLRIEPGVMSGRTSALGPAHLEPAYSLNNGGCTRGLGKGGEVEDQMRPQGPSVLPLIERRQEELLELLGTEPSESSTPFSEPFAL